MGGYTPKMYANQFPQWFAAVAGFQTHFSTRPWVICGASKYCTYNPFLAHRNLLCIAILSLIHGISEPFHCTDTTFYAYTASLRCFMSNFQQSSNKKSCILMAQNSKQTACCGILRFYSLCFTSDTKSFTWRVPILNLANTGRSNFKGFVVLLSFF